MVGRKQTRQSGRNLKAPAKRKSVSTKNYAESSGSEEDTDDEFEPVKKVSKTPNGRKKLSQKSPQARNINGKQHKNSTAKNIKEDEQAENAKVNGSVLFGQVARPFLSESESSDDDVCLNDLNEVRDIISKKVEVHVSGKNVAKIQSPKKRSNVKVEANSTKANSCSITEQITLKEERKEKKGKLTDCNADEKLEKKAKSSTSNGVKTEKKDFSESKKESPSKDLAGKQAKRINKSIGPKGKIQECHVKVEKELIANKEVSSTSIKGNKSRGKIQGSDRKEKISAIAKNEIKNKKGYSGKVLNSSLESSPSKKTGAGKSKSRAVAQKNTSKIKSFESLPGPSHTKDDLMSSDADESESEDGWEDVHEAEIDKSLHESPKKERNKDINVKDIAVSLKIKSIHKSKSQKNKDKFLQCMERTMRRFQNQVQTNLHKCHLVCLVARLRFLNTTCNDPALKALLISFVPVNFTKVPTSKWDLKDLQRFLFWFQTQDTGTLLATRAELTGVPKRFSQIQIFVAALRSFGLLARLVMSLQPITWKVDNAELFRVRTGDKNEKKDTGKKENSVKRKNSKSLSETNSKSHGKRKKLESGSSSSKHANETTTSPYFKKETSDTDINKELHETEGFAKGKQKAANKKEGTGSLQKDSKSAKSVKRKIRETASEEIGRKTGRARKKINYEEDDLGNNDKRKESDNDLTEDNFNDASEDNGYDSDEGIFETPKKSRKSLAAKLSDKKGKKSCMPSVDRGYAKKLLKTIDDDDDFEKTSKPVKGRRSLNNKAESPKVSVVSSDSESCHSKESLVTVSNPMATCDIWCEVFLKSVKKWICIELHKKTIDDPSQCEKTATQPLQYVLGIDNENAIKDVTCRYASKFMSKTRKIRIDREWWAETLYPYETKDKKRDNVEDTQLKMNLMQQPFPTTVGEFKNHPLYVLEGDLLKFEGIYPESPAALGYFRNKAIYARDCVHILHTRENWLKEARVVKQGEKAYKIVRGRPKKNTPVHERDKVKIDLFGLWQTEVYKPPPVKNGKVPRNEYGNVELFQPSMLPPGGVHIPIQGIHKTARKLGIDAAPAMMGWDFHGGYAHPIIEGVVVAAEFEEKLLDAWQKDEDERERKLKEKNEKKIYDRWKTLVKGLLVRERIRRKYDFRESEDMERCVSHKDEEKAADDVAVSWPLNKQEGTTSLNEKGHCHVFPESSYKQDKVKGEWTKSCSCGLSLPFEKL